MKVLLHHEALLICPNLSHLNSITAVLTRLLILVESMLLNPANLPALPETPKHVQAANSGVQRPMQVFLVRATLLLEGDPSHDNEEARKSYSSSDDERKV